MQERRVLEALLGAYVTTLLIPGVALFTGTLDADGVPVLVGAGVIVAVLVAGMARIVDDLADTVASAPVAVTTGLPPLGYPAYMILGAEPESPAAFASAVGSFAFLPCVLVPVGGEVVHNRRLREAATEVTAVTVGDGTDDDGTDWPLIAGTAVALFSVVIAVGIAFVSGGTGMGAIAPALGGVSTWFLILGDDDATEIAVTDRGLRIDRGFTPWNDLDGYRVGEEEVEFVRTQRYLPTRSFERERIDDEDAFIQALNRYLPRLDERGRVSAA
jgi:hypothetical protein